MPDTPPAPIRGRTTQNRVSARAKCLTLLSRATVATTCDWSLLNEIAETVPTTTSLHLTGVLPASRPPAVWKLMVICGPAEDQVWITIDTPISAATSGTSQ